jgi:COP9 signalosome complex subunit 1
VPVSECSSPGATLLHAEDVATYAALAAGACFSRDDLQSNFMGVAGGKQLLEQAPAMREVLVALVACRYSAALKTLESLQPALACDPYLHPVLDTVISSTRRRCIEQYVQPYSTVDIVAMAAVFNMRCDKGLSSSFAFTIALGIPRNHDRANLFAA